ncbi:MAG TPA: DUF1830 domain-containing protein [Nodosilinea sp.]|nr:DUF1830 domain-containing protein [Nodosilinea sp.]
MISLVSAHKIRCRYTNPTDQFQIVRVSHLPYSFLERTVLPHESIVFEAFPQDNLEIHTSAVAGAILSDRIPCDRLVCAPSEARRYPRHLQQSA